jgi:AraC-like DNA-binding protein
MKKPLKSAVALKILHSIESLGVSPASAGEIRAERLEQRLRPKVPFPHRHDFYHFLFVEKGNGWHEIDFKKHKVKNSQLFLVQPGQVHGWSLSAGVKGFVVEFTKESLPASSQGLLLQLESLQSAYAIEGPELGGIFRLMQKEFENKQPAYRQCLELLLQSMLLMFSRLHPAPAPSPIGTSLLERFRLALEKNYRREHKVEAYAKILGESPKRLSAEVKKHLGKSAGTVIQERCLAEAKRLLAYSEMPVAEVGYELGYDDPNYFARFFRKHAGMAPGKFRQLASRTVHG